MWRGPLVVQPGRLCFNSFTGGSLVSTSAVGERKAGRGQLGGMECKHRHQVPSRVGMPVFAFSGKRKPKCDY